MANLMLWDPIRKFEVADTPEERVRQSVLNYLLEVLKVPPRLIGVELSLAHFSNSQKLRVDIVVFQPATPTFEEKSSPLTNATPGGLRAWLLVECKAPHIAVDESVARQMERYQNVLPSRFVLVTNGNQSVHFERVDKVWQRCGGLPVFSFTA